MTFGDIILLALAVSAASMTITTSNVTEWLRVSVSKLGQRFEELIHCPYCLSHWLAAIVTVAWFKGPMNEMIVAGFAIVTIASLASLGITHFFLALDALDRSE
jgi:hypothetical protein